MIYEIYVKSKRRDEMLHAFKELISLLRKNRIKHFSYDIALEE